MRVVGWMAKRRLANSVLCKFGIENDGHGIFGMV